MPLTELFLKFKVNWGGEDVYSWERKVKKIDKSVQRIRYVKVTDLS